MRPPHDPTPKFQQVFNFRDLGGHHTAPGQRTKHGVLFRSAALTDATHSDFEILNNVLGIRTLLDLRHGTERTQFPMPVDTQASLVAIVLFQESDNLLEYPTLTDAYVEFVNRRHIGEQLVSVLSLLADESVQPTVFFCGAGKDRTGLVTEAILGLLGVSDDAISDDYAKSADQLEPLFALWSKNPASTIDEVRRTTPQLTGTPRESMTALLTFIGQNFGTMKGNLEAHGANSELFEALDRALLE